MNFYVSKLFSVSSLFVYNKPAFLQSPENFLEQEERNRSKGSFHNYVDKKRGKGEGGVVGCLLHIHMDWEGGGDFVYLSTFFYMYKRGWGVWKMSMDLRGGGQIWST